MKSLESCAAASILLADCLAIAMTASAASPASAPGKNKLQCFDGPSDGSIYGGTCTLTTNGAKGPATLDNTGGDTAGSYSGVYVLSSNLTGKTLASAGQLSFNYTGIPTNGSPRISLPLDTDGDGVTDLYAFVSAYWCSNGAGLVDAINNPACQIYVGSDVNPYVGWAALLAAYPTAVMGPDGALPFIISDDAGSTAIWTVSNVTLGKPGR
jgi:hypothetical protein